MTFPQSTPTHTNRVLYFASCFFHHGWKEKVNSSNKTKKKCSPPPPIPSSWGEFYLLFHFLHTCRYTACLAYFQTCPCTSSCAWGERSAKWSARAHRAVGLRFQSKSLPSDGHLVISVSLSEMLSKPRAGIRLFGQEAQSYESQELQMKPLRFTQKGESVAAWFHWILLLFFFFFF